MRPAALKAKELPPDIASAVDKVIQAFRDKVLATSGLDLIQVRTVPERDAEVYSWMYAVVTFELAGSPEAIAAMAQAENRAIEEVYPVLTPEEATKVLVMFDYEPV